MTPGLVEIIAILLITIGLLTMAIVHASLTAGANPAHRRTGAVRCR